MLSRKHKEIKSSIFKRSLWNTQFDVKIFAFSTITYIRVLPTYFVSTFLLHYIQFAEHLGLLMMNFVKKI